MEIQLSGKIADIVKSKVASGGYQNATAFISDIILRADEFDQLKLDRLRQEIKVGIDEINRGETTTFDLDDILNENSS